MVSGAGTLLPMEAAVATRMTEHVVELARRHRVTLRWAPRWRDAYAYPGQRLAVVPLIRRPSDYLFALHEIGHCADRVARSRAERQDRYTVTLVEGAAWAWANKHADPRLTRHLRAKDWNTVAYAWRTYLDPSRQVA